MQKAVARAWPADAHGSRCRGIPSVSITSENGAEYIKHISLGQGSGASAHPCGGGYYVTSSAIILADMPMGYRALRVSVGGTRIAVASQSIRCCRNRSAVSCGSDSAAVILSAPKSPGEPAISTTHGRCFRTYADFLLVNPLRAAEPVLSLILSPYSPDSCQFADHMCIRPENVGGILFTGRHARQQVECLCESVARLDSDVTRLNRRRQWRVKMPALWDIFKAGRSQPARGFDEYYKERGIQLTKHAAWYVARGVRGRSAASPDPGSTAAPSTPPRPLCWQSPVWRRSNSANGSNESPNHGAPLRSFAVRKTGNAHRLDVRHGRGRVSPPGADV